MFVGFTKVTDGRFRYDMLCTTNMNLVPARDIPRPGWPPPPPGLIRVYDLHKMAWRSFYVHTVLYIFAKE